MSATSVGQIGLDLVVNQKQFDKQLKGIGSVAKKAGATIAAAFGVKKLVNFGKESVKLGSDLQEVQNVVDVTFPHMTAQVDKFAQKAASSFGLSETMAKKYTGTFGAMAKAFGFSESAAFEMGTTLTGLAGDVASFYNLSQDEAYTKLKSVFTGETESLKELGVVMTQSALDSYAMANGFGKTTKSMSEAEKVALRYAFVQNQLSAASGDFMRTSDGWANQVRILQLNFESLKATIGQGLINVLTPVIKVINIIIGKLMTLANAFKAFTELITGKKSKGGSSGVKEMASAAGDAAAGMSGASGAADGMANSAKKAGGAAKKAAKDMKTLMGFDQINKVSEGKDSSGGGGASGAGMDFGSLADGENAADKLDKSMSKLLKRAKELGALFEKGFSIGFGDSEKRLISIQKHIKGIEKSIKDIFTDKSVIESANKMLDSLALNFGKISGSIANVGITIADNLVGGFDKYLNGSSSYIKNRIISVFDVSSDIANLAGNFSTAFANVFSIFSGENAKNCTASLIGIFSDGFLGVLELGMKFGEDFINLLVKPFIDNQERIKESIDNFMKPVSKMLETIHKSIRDTFEKLQKAYDEHISPMFQSFSDGWSEIAKTLLDGYNQYIQPVLDRLAEKFTKVWNEHLQPTIDKAIEFIGKVADAITDIWEKTMQPFISWIVGNIFPVIAPILEKLGNKFIDTLDTICGVADGILEALGGVVDFVAGVFTADWSRAWEGIKTIFKGVWDAMVSYVKAPINKIIGFINSLIRGVASGINSVVKALNGMSFKIPDWVPAYGGKKFGLNIHKVSAPQIPKLAKGGYVKPNTPQLAMIGDNRHQGEVVAPEDKMIEMAMKAAKMAAGTGGITKAELESIVNAAVMKIVAALTGLGFYIDSELIALAVQKGLKSLDERYNPVEFI